MPSPKSHLRPAAVAAVLAGEQSSAVAKRYGLDRTTVARWCREDAPQLSPEHARTRERMAEAIYDALIDIFAAVRAQLQTATQKEWLEKQTAGELATLLGTELDRAIRLLAGFKPAPDGDGDGAAIGAQDAPVSTAERTTATPKKGFSEAPAELVAHKPHT